MQDAGAEQGGSGLQATARQRLAGLLDPGSFTEFLGDFSHGLQEIEGKS